MATFPRFDVVRRCFDTAKGWSQYKTTISYTAPVTLHQAKSNAFLMDWKNSQTLSVTPSH
jgi:hypothetical protein